MGAAVTKRDMRFTSARLSQHEKHVTKQPTQKKPHLGKPSSSICFPRPLASSIAATSTSKMIWSGTNFPRSMNLQNTQTKKTDGQPCGVTIERLCIQSGVPALRGRVFQASFFSVPPTKKKASLASFRRQQHYTSGAGHPRCWSSNAGAHATAVKMSFETTATLPRIDSTTTSKHTTGTKLSASCTHTLRVQLNTKHLEYATAAVNR